MHKDRPRERDGGSEMMRKKDRGDLLFTDKERLAHSLLIYIYSPDLDSV